MKELPRDWNLLTIQEQVDFLLKYKSNVLDMKYKNAKWHNEFNKFLNSKKIEPIDTAQFLKCRYEITEHMLRPICHDFEIFFQPFLERIQKEYSG